MSNVERRPIVAYTKVLNGLTTEEWHKLKLPSPSSCRPKPNLQIADVAADPSFVPSLSSLSLGRAVSDGLGACPTPTEVVPIVDDALAEVGPNQRLCHNECVPGPGGVAFCVWDAREAKQCHDECFPGLGGEMLCLYDDLGEIDDVGLETNGDRDVDDHVPLSTGSNQVNTRASASRAVVLAEEILGLELLDPLPHQVGSTPGGVKPPSPDNIQHR